MENDSPVLEGKAVTIGYAAKQGRKVVHANLNFRLHRGELVCLLGANGIGKSTLLRTLATVQPPLEGELNLAGQPLSDYTDRERSRLIGIVLTTHTQAGGLTVRELVALGRQPYTGFFGRLRSEDEDKVESALQAVGMADKAQRYVAQLSDGERQKAMIAKVLVQECPLVLLDEPTAFLDVVSRIEIMSLLHRLAVEEKRAILLSTHDVEQALTLADKLWLLSETDGLQCGATEDLVLAGCMDNLFSHTAIRFDTLHGGYSPVSPSERHVVLTAADAILWHWAQNALNRNGWSCLSAQSPAAECPHLDVRSATDIRYVQGEREETFSSFSQLTAYLRTK